MCMLQYVQSISISWVIQINYVMITSYTGYFVLKKCPEDLEIVKYVLDCICTYA